VNPFLKAVIWLRGLFVPESDPASKPVFFLSQRASEEFFDKSAVVAGDRARMVDAEKECVSEFEIQEVRIEHGIGEQAVALLFVAAQNDSNILKIRRAPVLVI
jgi:hypothetical protein